jgi:hypothetical protein
VVNHHPVADSYCVVGHTGSNRVHHTGRLVTNHMFT